MSRTHILARSGLVMALLAGVAVLLAVGLPAMLARGADHGDAPFAATDGRLDIADVYAFKSGANTVLIMTVNPDAGVISPTTLRPGVRYEIAIDNDGDSMEDIVYQLKTSNSVPQNVVLKRVTGSGGGPAVARGMAETIIPVSGGGSLFVGLRDDPFFADVAGIFAAVGGGPAPSGPDNFAGQNVSAIVLEVPSLQLTDTGPTIRVWARTVSKGKQVDRKGLPGINTFLIPSGSKDDFNATKPEDDVATWSTDVEASIQFLSGLDGSGCSGAEAAFIRSLLLPDVLILDTSSSAGMVPALNGRQLAEDVVDFALVVLTGGLCTANPPPNTPVLSSDGVPINDKTFLGVFPYLATPH